ncbi:MAG: pyridoxamine 5'-phosphate oxidase [Gemmatimonadales bacterium]|nr:MAG: pyridoxamine 5'-phosphate oxidase [Gemmatimonadales bacterium]
MSGHPSSNAPAQLHAPPGPDPLVAFHRWLEEAREHGKMEYPNAMTLATVDGDGRPDARIVLLKELDQRGFVFYTNYRSAKGRQLAGRGVASLVFYWDAMGRQVRTRGPVERVSAEESDAYFASRPRGSRLGAWASEQSRVLTGREELEARLESVSEQYDGREAIPRPPHWGGFLLRPREVEFWQAGAFRLHDRFLYRRQEEGDWSVVRLSP